MGASVIKPHYRWLLVPGCEIVGMVMRTYGVSSLQSLSPYSSGLCDVGPNPVGIMRVLSGCSSCFGDRYADMVHLLAGFLTASESSCVVICVLHRVTFCSNQ